MNKGNWWDHDGAGARLANILLRAVAMGVKLLTFVLLARFLGVEDFARLGLFLVTVTLCLYLVGLDFYTFSQREFIAAPQDERGWIAKQHFLVMGISAVTLLPLIGLAQYGLPLGPRFALWLLLIVFLEHFAQELVRLLTANGAPLAASVLGFFRQALWGPPVLLIMLFDEQRATLDTVFTAWALSVALGLAFGAFVLRRSALGGWERPLVAQWVRRGFIVALPMLLATIAQRLIFSLDRYLVEALNDLSVLAAYSLFVTLAGGLIAMADATFTVFSYPRLIDAHARRDQGDYDGEFRRYLTQMASVAVLGSCLLYFCTPLVLAVLPDAAYANNAYLFPYVLAGVSFYLLSTVFHFGLFARNRDGAILASNLLSLLALLVSVPALQALQVEPVVPVAVLGAFATLFVAKVILYRRSSF